MTGKIMVSMDHDVFAQNYNDFCITITHPTRLPHVNVENLEILVMNQSKEMLESLCTT